MALNVGNLDVVLAAATSVELTALAGQSITILKATVCNTDSVPRTVTINRIPNGGAAATSNAIVDALVIGAGATVVLPLSGQSLVNQQSLCANASAAAVVNLNIGYASTP